MKEMLALVAYGLLLIAGAFMTFFWGRIAIRRKKQLAWNELLHDTYFVLAASLCISSIGTGVLFAARSYGFMAQAIATVKGDSFTAYMVLLGLFIMGFAKVGFIWAIQLDRRSWIWRMFIILSALWVVLAVYWAFYDPMQIYPYD